MIYLHELTPLTVDERVVPEHRVELARAALNADERILVAAWSEPDVNLVIDCDDGDDDDVLVRVASAWRDTQPAVWSYDYWTTASDPVEWRWALRPAAEWARYFLSLSGRHQCSDRRCGCGLDSGCPPGPGGVSAQCLVSNRARLLVIAGADRDR